MAKKNNGQTTIHKTLQKTTIWLSNTILTKNRRWTRYSVLAPHGAHVFSLADVYCHIHSWYAVAKDSSTNELPYLILEIKRVN